MEKLYIDKTESELKEILRSVNKTLDEKTEGSLIIRNRKGRSYYSISVSDICGKKREKYISVSDEKVRKMLNRSYCQKLKPLIEKELLALRRIENAYRPEEKYNVLDHYPVDCREKIDPLLISWDQIAAAWASAEYKHNEVPLDPARSYRTKDGVYVRSKSEFIISEIIDDLRLPRRYELLYDGVYFKSYPDFTLLNPVDHQLYFVEYFGMMDNPDYAQRAMEKIARYQKTSDAGRFIFFFESKYTPLDPSAVRNTLKCRLGLDGR